MRKPNTAAADNLLYYTYVIAQIHRDTTDTVLTRVSFAKNLDGCGHFLLTDSFILLSLGSGLEALPGEGAQVEVHENIAKRLQVITPGLLCGHKV